MIRVLKSLEFRLRKYFNLLIKLRLLPQYIWNRFVASPKTRAVIYIAENANWRDADELGRLGISAGTRLRTDA